MFNAIIAACAGIVIAVIGIIVGGIALTGVWSASDHIVQNSGSPQLQSTYQTGKGMIDTASNVQDTWNFVKSASLLVGLPIGGYSLIWFLKEIEIL